MTDNLYTSSDRHHHTCRRRRDVVLRTLVRRQPPHHVRIVRSAAWATFPLDASNRTKHITFNTAGVYPYHCTAHGGFSNGVLVGMSGTITVQGTPTATEDARLTALALSLFPNPSHGLRDGAAATRKPGQAYQLRLSNVIGQEVRTVALRPEPRRRWPALNLSDLPARHVLLQPAGGWQGGQHASAWCCRTEPGPSALLRLPKSSPGLLSVFMGRAVRPCSAHRA
ncbi:MAG: hypothetical protein WKG07_20115 [Hymenobacter sp.]